MPHVTIIENELDIVKPCSVREVIARSRAVLRRTGWAVATSEGSHEQRGNHFDRR